MNPHGGRPGRRWRISWGRSLSPFSSCGCKTGKDIRAEGSGNAGATNVLRAHGKKLGLPWPLLDSARAPRPSSSSGTVTADPRYAAAAALPPSSATSFPIFYGFRGGKGVATAVGAFLVLAPSPTLVCIGIFLAVVAATRYVSLGSIVAMVLLPPVAGALFHAPRPVVRGRGDGRPGRREAPENLKRLAAGRGAQARPEVKVAVLGAGSWGTALAIHFARCGHDVLLWGRDPEVAARDPARTGAIPGGSRTPIPPGVRGTADLGEALAFSETRSCRSVPCCVSARVLAAPPDGARRGSSRPPKGSSPRP